MEFLQLAEARYSVRKFSSRPVEKASLERILHAAQLAPTATNAQPQRLLVLTEAESLAKLSQCTKYHFHAPAAVIVCYDTRVCWVRKDYDGASSGIIDASIVTTHMMLAAVEEGLGTTWVMLFDPAALRELYALPDYIEPVAILPLGYPAEDSKPSPKHEASRPLEDIVVYESFGE